MRTIGRIIKLKGGCYLPTPAEPRGITPSILRPHPIITNNDDTND